MASNDFFYKVESLSRLRIEIAKVETRYSTLSELWDNKSKAKIHLDISRKMDEALVKVEGLRKLEKEIDAEIEKGGR